MLLTTPYVLGIDQSPHRNQLRQIAVPVQAVEGTLVTFTRDRVTGWLFQPTVGHEPVLIIPTKKKLDRVPDTRQKQRMRRTESASASKRMTERPQQPSTGRRYSPYRQIWMEVTPLPRSLRG